MAISARRFTALVVCSGSLLLLFFAAMMSIEKEASASSILLHEHGHEHEHKATHKKHTHAQHEHEGHAHDAQHDALVAAALSAAEAATKATEPAMTADERISYEYKGPFEKVAELALKTGLEMDARVKIVGQLGDRYIMEINSETQDSMLHVSLRPHQQSLVVNEQTGGVWGKEKSVPNPIKADHDTDLVIHVRSDGYAVSVDGQELVVYPHLHDFHGATTLSLRPDAGAEQTTVVIKQVTVTGAPVKRIVVRDMLKGVSNEGKRQPDLSADRHVRLFVGVMSQPSNSVNRYAVRNAWFQYDAVHDGKVAVRFFVGKSDNVAHMDAVKEEIAVYNDIVISPFPEGYYRIANKTRYIMEVGATHINADFIMKCDDDTFVRLDRLLPELDRQRPDGLYMGTITYSGSPIRDPNSKWYISPADFPENNFPPFAHGPGYVVSRNIAMGVTEAFANKEVKAFTLEDISMATWVDHLRRRKGVTVNVKSDSRFNIGSCGSRDVIGHYISPHRMVCMWRKVKDGENDWCC